ISLLSLNSIAAGTMARVDVDTLTMEQYLALSRENQAPSVVKPEIEGNVNLKTQESIACVEEDTFYGQCDNSHNSTTERPSRVLESISSNDWTATLVNRPPGYYTKTDNRPLYGEKRQRLEELLAKHQEEFVRRSTEIEVWIKKLQENAEINTRSQSASLKNLKT
ncbi:hypothetical protein Tco_0266272, partial [Tanacetum coccineum]